MTFIRRAFLILMLLLIIAPMVFFGNLYIKNFGAPGSVNNFINKKSLTLIGDSPEALTFMGLDGMPLIDRHSHRLADYTEAQWDVSLGKAQSMLDGLNKYDPEKLKGQDLLSYEITKWLLEDQMGDTDLRYTSYPISQLSGPHVNLPSFLTDRHAIKTQKSVDNYLSRLREFGRVLNETHVLVDTHTEKGVIPPDFIVKKTIGVLEAFIEDGPAENPLVNTLPKRLEEAGGFSDEATKDILAEAEKIVTDVVIPGYEKLIAQQKALLPKTNSDAGIYRIPNGERIYATAVRSNTTTDFSADDIHETGLSEVTRIEAAMDKILITQGLTEGTVSERVRILMEDPDQLFPNTDEGREAMIEYLVELNTDIMGKADKYFVTLPPQELEIKRVPEFSQDSAPGGYYQPPGIFDSTPGRFYINQKDTADNPKWTLPTLLYHEAAPGHHFQISRSQMIEGVPFLRKMSPFTAYTEGWALYAERVAAEDMGLYADNPLGDLGRLQAEQFRAVRLVVDTGLHHKRWTREQAIEYMVSKTGMTEAEVTREIERYVVWPGQALAYKTGQLAILRMRARAEKELGEKFNLRLFQRNDPGRRRHAAGHSRSRSRQMDRGAKGVDFLSCAHFSSKLSVCGRNESNWGDQCDCLSTHFSC